MRFVAARPPRRVQFLPLTFTAVRRAKPFAPRRFRYFAELFGVGMLLTCFLALAVFG